MKYILLMSVVLILIHNASASCISETYDSGECVGYKTLCHEEADCSTSSTVFSQGPRTYQSLEYFAEQSAVSERVCNCISGVCGLEEFTKFSTTMYPTTSPRVHSPSTHPSESPTVDPTPAPTQSPEVEIPTHPPSASPSSSPDESTPNISPSQAPSRAPTQAPTEVPTQAPTEVPTQAPTESPTHAPIEYSVIDKCVRDVVNANTTCADDIAACDNLESCAQGMASLSNTTETISAASVLEFMRESTEAETLGKCVAEECGVDTSALERFSLSSNAAPLFLAWLCVLLVAFTIT